MSNNGAQQIPELVGLVPTNVKLDQLFLDPHNPRLARIRRGEEEERVPDEQILNPELQAELLSKIRTEVEIHDLVEKIRKLGFLSIDRIVVRPLSGNEESFVVLEGNRRLAAVRTLMDNAREYVTLPDHVKSSLDEVEVLVYEGDNEDIAWIIQGLRHIESIKQWGAFQRGRYLAEMQEQRGLSLADLAELAPVGRNTISRLIRSYHGFAQACLDDDFGDLVTEDDFSVFQEAVFHRNNSPLWQWLGWSDAERRFENEANLTTLLRLRKEDTEHGEPRIARVNPDLRDKFSSLVTGDHDPELDAFLEDRISLEAAYQQAQREEQETETLEDLVNLDSRASSLREMRAQLATLPILQIKEEDRSAEFIELLQQVQAMANGQAGLLD